MILQGNSTGHAGRCKELSTASVFLLLLYIVCTRIQYAKCCICNQKINFIIIILKIVFLFKTSLDIHVYCISFMESTKNHYQAKFKFIQTKELKGQHTRGD